MSDDVRIITMQTAAVTDHSTPASELDDYISFHRACEVTKTVAEHLLAQAYADGFALESVVNGGNDCVLLTTWTLRKRSLQS